jgi:hypothetical protein
MDSDLEGNLIDLADDEYCRDGIFSYDGPMARITEYADLSIYPAADRPLLSCALDIYQGTNNSNTMWTITDIVLEEVDTIENNEMEITPITPTPLNWITGKQLIEY